MKNKSFIVANQGVKTTHQIAESIIRPVYIGTSRKKKRQKEENDDLIEMNTTVRKIDDEGDIDYENKQKTNDDKEGRPFVISAPKKRRNDNS